MVELHVFCGLEAGVFCAVTQAQMDGTARPHQLVQPPHTLTEFLGTPLQQEVVLRCQRCGVETADEQRFRTRVRRRNHGKGTLAQERPKPVGQKQAGDFVRSFGFGEIHLLTERVGWKRLQHNGFDGTAFATDNLTDGSLYGRHDHHTFVLLRGEQRRANRHLTAGLHLQLRLQPAEIGRRHVVADSFQRPHFTAGCPVEPYVQTLPDPKIHFRKSRFYQPTEPYQHKSSYLILGILRILPYSCSEDKFRTQVPYHPFRQIRSAFHLHCICRESARHIPHLPPSKKHAPHFPVLWQQ